MAFEDANIDVDPTDRKGASLFDLLEQPFHILSVDPAATNLEINSAFTAARDREPSSEDALVSAREAILSPAKRLTCELSYPLDSRPKEIAVLYNALRSDASASELLLIADQLAPLSSAHFCAHMAARRPADSAVLYAIIVSHGAIDSAEIYQALKAFRAAARWPAPSLLSVDQGLREIFALHTEAAIRRYENIEDASEPVLECTQAILASGERLHIEVLARFLAAYRESVEIKRSRTATLVQNASAALRQQPEEARLAAVLSDALQFWGLLCGPLILFSAHQGRQIDEDVLAPAECVLLLVDDLTRQHHYTIAHQVAEAGRDVPGLAGPFDTQLRRIEHLASGGPLRELRGLTGQFEAEPSLLVEALVQSGFGPNARGAAGRLWEAFVEVTVSSNQADSIEPWTLLRDLAMRLSRSEHHAAASALIRGLIRQGQAIAAPPEISAMLPYDLMLIAGQKPAQAAEGRFVPPPGPAQVAVRPVQARSPGKPARKPARPVRKLGVLLKGFGLAGAALAGVGIYLGFDHLPALQWQQLLPPVLQGATSPEEEVMPPVGTGQRYSLPSVRYCHFQQERLKTIKELALGPEDVRAYNLLVVDYNSRCSDFLYQPQDLVTVVAEVGAQKSRLEADAKRIMSAWPGHGAEGR